MREEKLFRAIGDVGDDLIARADEPVQKKKPVRLDSRAGFRAVWGLIVWGCGRCTASSVGGWVSDLSRVGVCCVCPGCRRAV